MTRARPATIGLRRPAVAALLLAAVADILLFRSLGAPLGLPVPLFVLALGTAVTLCNRRRERRFGVPAVALLAAAVLPVIESVDLLQVAVAVLGLAAYALLQARPLSLGAGWTGALIRFVSTLPAALAVDAWRARKAGRRRPGLRLFDLDLMSGAAWIMPVVVAGGFVLLLGAGNPILAGWIAALDLVLLLDPERLVFWTAAVILVWPFLRPRLRRIRPAPSLAVSRPAATASSSASPLSAALFGAPAIRRALILFNLVFAAQTLLDAVYLWGGAELPAGIGYAAYAHRGAYTLVAAALLSAGFVLFALRPGRSEGADRGLRALVYLWIGQNVFLVLSAMLRLDLYVDVYALTHWRVAAFLWMGLVAAGLLLIVGRIVLDRSNRWLVGANLAAAGAMLYACCFVDVAGLIARFNVEHSLEISGQGVALDMAYLEELGPAAIPALDRFAAATRPTLSRPAGWDAAPHAAAVWCRARLAEAYARTAGTWRSWTFRNWRLTRYLEAGEAASASPQPAPAVW